MQLTKFLSVYLIKGDDGDILIDTGFLFMRRRLFKLLDKHNVKYIILTHAHLDHVWNAAVLKERYNAKIAIGKKDVKNLDNRLLRSNSIKWYLRPVAGIYNFGFKVLKQKEIIVDEELEVGETITKHGITFKIIDLEGHTPGSIGIIDKDNNLYCGDAILSRFGKVRLTWQNNDNEKAIETVRKIINSDINTIFFGHSKPRNKSELMRLDKIVNEKQEIC